MENLETYTSENLNPEEVINPMLVLADFFNDDWLPGHLERLKVWRDYIIDDDYFRGIKNSPAELLYFHKLNIRLIEALYLVIDKPRLSDAATDITALELEKSVWRDFPPNLNNAELLNPYIVIQLFFKSCSLQQYRNILYEWLEYGLSSSSANEFIETKDLVVVYENLQKLYSAAWLIYQRESEKLFLKNDLNNKVIKNDDIISSKSETLACLYQLDSTISPDSEATLKKLIGVIKHKVPSVQAIIYLGKIPDRPDKIFLLVLTADTELNQASSLSSTIEESVSKLADVTALVHFASALFSAVTKNNFFFCRALNSPVIYLSGDLLLPVPKPTNSLLVNKDASFNWERWQSQGREFLAGAEFYLKRNAVKAALFSLHQCSECLLIAIVRAVLGYRINNHNLSKLLQITQMFTPDLNRLFGLDVPENKQLFDLLKHAYVNVRYRDAFEPDTKSLAALYLVIKKLVTLTGKVYEQHILTATI
jgi:HEPN domain-containing protein